MSEQEPHALAPHVLAHQSSIQHREQIEASERCGCFYCLATFAPSEITSWLEAEGTALCPNCDIDSVIGSASGFPITPEFLGRMQAHWF